MSVIADLPVFRGFPDLVHDHLLQHDNHRSAPLHWQRLPNRAGWCSVHRVTRASEPRHSAPETRFSALSWTLSNYQRHFLWDIELAFKRLKSLIGLKGPPGKHPDSARPYILAHLLLILILEPVIDEFEDSPHWDEAA